MAELNNAVITDARLITSKDNWTLYKVLVEGDSTEYSYFKNPKNPTTPQKGMTIISAIINVSDKGTALNKTVFDGSGTPTPPTAQKQSEGDKLYIDHGKVIVEAIRQSEGDMGKFGDFLKMFRVGEKFFKGTATVADFAGVHEFEEPDGEQLPF